jgi:trans-2,3-dihydro-3-hydroxyanthranilate isomerase
MNLPFYIVDVFTEKKYAGNQLAVFLDAHSLSTEQMQLIAREINFAESTFITKRWSKCAATIRIFTPEHEMQFAGHLSGTSWVLMNKIFENKPDKITVTVPVGEIPVRQVGDWYGYKLLNLSFGYFSKEDFTTFSNLGSTDFEDAFPIQEVTTGSAFVIVPLKK